MYWITAIIGAASIVAPFIFGFNTDITALWTSIGIGAALLAASLFEGIAQDRENWEYWVVGIVGLASIGAPFLLGFASLTAAWWTLVGVGAVALITAGAKLTNGRIQLG